MIVFKVDIVKYGVWSDCVLSVYDCQLGAATVQIPVASDLWEHSLHEQLQSQTCSLAYAYEDS